MGKKLGKHLRPEVRYIRLTDGTVRELKMDFSAKAEIEAVIVPGVRKLAEKLGRVPTEAEVQAHDFGMGPSLQTAWMAYCLSTTWREDNGKADETFIQFKRLMPMDDDEFAAIKAATDACMSHLQKAEAEQAEGDQGNAPEAAPEAA